MELNNFSTSSELLSNEIILEQLQKIKATQPFAVSEILRNFLTYIVHETLSGGADCIKEYTIGVYVLNKPAKFKPYKDCVVRVHARRLRVALKHYYESEGKNEDCIISIPKGRYAADFKSRTIQSQQEQRIAVIPFRCYDENNQMMAFAELLRFSMNTRLSSLPGFSVAPFYTTGLFAVNTGTTREMTARTSAEYILAGAIFQDVSSVRVFAELIDTSNDRQVWSEMKKFIPGAESLFELSDQISACLMLGIERIKSPVLTVAGRTEHDEPVFEKPCIPIDHISKEKSGKLPVVKSAALFNRKSSYQR
jgi:TolB-like protein